MLASSGVTRFRSMVQVRSLECKAFLNPNEKRISSTYRRCQPLNYRPVQAPWSSMLKALPAYGASIVPFGAEPVGEVWRNGKKFTGTT